MSFNMSALTYHAPGGFVFEQGKRSMYFYRQAQGTYEFHGSETLEDICAAAGLVTPTSRLALESVYKAGAGLGYALKGNPWGRRTPEYQGFLEAQNEFFRGVRHLAEGQRAAAEFRQQADQLLMPLSTAELRGMKLRDLANPVRCRALNKRREGVFVWPHWQYEDTVHVVVSTDPSVQQEVTSQVYAWLESNKLRIALNASF